MNILLLRNDIKFNKETFNVWRTEIRIENLNVFLSRISFFEQISRKSKLHGTRRNLKSPKTCTSVLALDYWACASRLPAFSPNTKLIWGTWVRTIYILYKTTHWYVAEVSVVHAYTSAVVDHHDWLTLMRASNERIIGVWAKHGVDTFAAHSPWIAPLLAPHVPPSKYCVYMCDVPWWPFDGALSRSCGRHKQHVIAINA